MNIIDDKHSGIILNHNTDWSGKVRVAWYDISERREVHVHSAARCPRQRLGTSRIPWSAIELGPVPPSLRECHCAGRDLIEGRFTRIDGIEPPLNVVTRAVALAVESYLRAKMQRALDDLSHERRRL